MKYYYFASFLGGNNDHETYMHMTFHGRRKIISDADFTEIIDHIKEKQKIEKVALINVTLLAKKWL